MFKKCAGLSCPCSYNEWGVKLLSFKSVIQVLLWCFFLSVWNLIALVLLYICYIENSSNDILHKFIFCINLKKESYVNDDRLVIVRWTINLRVSFLVDHFLSLLNIVAVFFFFLFFVLDGRSGGLKNSSLSFLLVCYFVTFCCPVYFSYQA